MTTVKINDINIYYELHGEGEPLVLIPGLGSEITFYEPMIRLFSEKYKVLSFDNRGAGRTDKPDIPYTIEMMADDTLGLLDALGITHANVLGISMGGRIAMAIALQYPERVKSLILTSTFAQLTRKNLPFRFRLFKFISGNSKVFRKYPQPYYAFLRQLKASRDYDCSNSLDKIIIPTIILHGRDDRIVPFKLAEVLHEKIKGSQLIAFDGGHLFSFRKSKEYTDTVCEFLASIEK